MRRTYLQDVSKALAEQKGCRRKQGTPILFTATEPDATERKTICSIATEPNTFGLSAPPHYAAVAYLFEQLVADITDDACYGNDDKE